MSFKLDLKPKKSNFKYEVPDPNDIPVYQRQCFMLIDTKISDSIDVSARLKSIGFHLFCTGPPLKNKPQKPIQLYNNDNYNSNSDSNDEDIDMEEEKDEYHEHLLTEDNSDMDSDFAFQEMQRYILYVFYFFGF